MTKPTKVEMSRARGHKHRNEKSAYEFQHVRDRARELDEARRKSHNQFSPAEIAQAMADFDGKSNSE